MHAELPREGSTGTLFRAALIRAPNLIRLRVCEFGSCMAFIMMTAPLLFSIRRVIGVCSEK
jgi:hypothetical protein